MRHQSTQGNGNPTGDLEQVGRELAEWRRENHAPTPIPESLWSRAAALAAQHGTGAVARALCLNHTQLKRRMETVPTAGSALTFVELLPPPMPTNIGECAMEVESHRGNRMRVVLKDVPPLCLAGLLREFVG